MGTRVSNENDEAHSEEEIKLIINASQKDGVIDDTEGEIIQNAIDFSEICAHEIMIPRQDMKCLYLDDTYDEIMEFVRGNKHTRYPLCKDDKDSIVGMIHIRDLLEHQEQLHDKDILSKIARKILFVPENKSISEILHQMMAKHIHIAIVVDEYGGTAGMLSMEDILEELVGDIMDEHDDMEEEPMKMLSDTVCQFEGTYLIEDAYECLGLPEIEYEESTIAVMFSACWDGSPKSATRLKTITAFMKLSAWTICALPKLKRRLKFTKKTKTKKTKKRPRKFRGSFSGGQFRLKDYRLQSQANGYWWYIRQFPKCRKAECMFPSKPLW